MAQKIKIACPYLFILFLVGLLIGFNTWTGLNKVIKAADLTTTLQVGNQSPVIHAVWLNGETLTTITLIEDSTVDIMASAEIEDANGCDDVRSGGGVEAYVYSTKQMWVYGTGTTCSQDNNDCYDWDIISCSWRSTSGNTCYYDCTASDAMHYYADPTIDNGGDASESQEEWVVMVFASDSYWADVVSYSYDATPSNSAEVALLLAMTASTAEGIDYETVSPDSESNDIETGVRNTGNRSMDPELSGTTMAGPGTAIPIDSQQYDISTFDTDNGTSLSASATALDVTAPQRTDDDDPYSVDDQIYWVLYVPAGQTPGDYTGTNTFTAAAD